MEYTIHCICHQCYCDSQLATSSSLSSSAAALASPPTEVSAAIAFLEENKELFYNGFNSKINWNVIDSK